MSMSKQMGAPKHVFLCRISVRFLVISAGDAISAKFHNKLLKRVKLHISKYMVRCFFQDALLLRSALDSEGPGPSPGPMAKHGRSRVDIEVGGRWSM